MKTINERYELVSVELLHPHEHNPNIGDTASIGESIETNGFYGAVTVREHPDIPGEYQILAGEHRWQTAKAQGAEEVPCIVVIADDVTAARVLLADNETAKRSRYDGDKLSTILDELGDVVGTGFDLADLSDFEDERRAKETPDPEPAEPSTDSGGFDPGPDEGSTGSENEPSYGIVVLCEDEAQQLELVAELTDRGIRHRTASVPN